MNDFTDATSITDAAGRGGKRMSRLGIVTMLLGFLVMLAPILVGFSLLWILGLLVAGAGLCRMFWAFQTGSLGKGVLVFAIGGLTLLAGIALLANPMLASGALTIVLAIYFVVDGAAEIGTAFAIPRGSRRRWMLFGGIVSIVLGVMIWRQFPLSGVWAIGVLLGIKLLFGGMIMVATGSTVRAVAGAMDTAAAGAEHAAAAGAEDAAADEAGDSMEAQ
ncbi:MAG: DUF308 domain-containing protein [Gemmatimonadetes bacterium]|nr:DUF308 domain-containing protein [Gemmatimonadota bacterium]